MRDVASTMAASADERVRGFVASAVAASVLAEEAPAEGLAAENPEPNVEDDEQRPIEFFDGGVQIEEAAPPEEPVSPELKDGVRMEYKERREAFLLRLQADANLGKLSRAARSSPRGSSEVAAPVELGSQLVSELDSAMRSEKFRSMVRLTRDRYAVLDESCGEVKRYTWNPSFGWTRPLPHHTYYE